MRGNGEEELVVLSQPKSFTVSLSLLPAEGYFNERRERKQ